MYNSLFFESFYFEINYFEFRKKPFCFSKNNFEIKKTVLYLKINILV